MSISQSKYVDIVSGVGGANIVPQRQLIARVFNDNDRIPVNAPLEFSSASAVGSYFGTSSEEYKRAAFYFGFVSKSLSTPTRISFSRWAKVAGNARIYGIRSPSTLAQFTAITAGALTLTIGAQTATLTGINLSAAGSFAAVATALQTAIRAAAGSNFTTATVVYDPVSGAFNLGSSTTGDNAISLAASPLATAIGWQDGAVFSPGTGAQSLTQALINSADQSNNFGSIIFVPVLAVGEVLEVATWNDAQNVTFAFFARYASQAELISFSAAVIGLSGTGLVYAPLLTEYDDVLPAAILAATDYRRANAVQNYMYQQAGGLTAKVVTTAASDAMDILRGNYYGNTQAAGSLISFFQRGILCGVVTDPTDMGTYANEMWLKDAAATALLGLFLGVANVPANVEGRAQILAILQPVIDQALLNGTFSVGKTLTAAQRLFVTQASDDDLAWQQVQSIGYWLDCVITPVVQGSGVTEYVALYTLIYSKNDAVRKVEGQHVLI